MNLKLKWEPEVYLLSRPHLSDVSLAEFMHSLGVDWSSDTADDADAIPEIAGRLCYLSYKNPRPGGNKAYLDHILQVGHGSVLEHSNFGFIFAGISRSLTHELVRHRAGMAYSQLSQRYVDESDCAFVVPWELHHEVRTYLREGCVIGDYEGHLAIQMAGSRWIATCKQALLQYTELVSYLSKKLAHLADGTERRKAARQTARSVLPNCTETMIYVTGNARAWRHMLEMRGSRHAEVEIRRLAVMVLDVLQQEAPNLFADYRREKLPDGTWEILTDHRKV